MFQKIATATFAATAARSVGVGEHELRALAAELEQHALEVRLGALVEERAPDLGGAR